MDRQRIVVVGVLVGVMLTAMMTTISSETPLEARAVHHRRDRARGRAPRYRRARRHLWHAVATTPCKR